MTRFAALLLSACTPTQPCETCPPVPARIAVDVCVDDAFDAGDRAASIRSGLAPGKGT